MAETIPLSSDFTFLEGTINANGIEVQSKQLSFMVSLGYLLTMNRKDIFRLPVLPAMNRPSAISCFDLQAEPTTTS